MIIVILKYTYVPTALTSSSSKWLALLLHAMQNAQSRLTMNGLWSPISLRQLVAIQPVFQIMLV